MKKIASEYFAGIGLIRMGLEVSGWEIAFANDFSEKKFEMYRDFFPDPESHYVINDIFALNPAAIPYTTLATCSFPCIDLSLAGNRNGIQGKHSSAFWGFINILNAQGDLAPPLVLVENVPGWLHSNNGADFRITVKALNDLGYVCDVFTLDALRFTPQSRLRVFLVGIKSSNIPLNATDIWDRPISLLPEMLRKGLMANRDLRWFDAQIPSPPPLKDHGLSDLVEMVDPSDSRWWASEEVHRHKMMMEQSHYDRVMRLVSGDRVVYRTFYRRIRKGRQRVEVRHDDLAGCLRTAVGGSGKQFLIKAGNGKIEMRAMTPREYARLQGVSDEFPIHVNGVQALTGFGDAVCVPAISWIGCNVLNPLVEKYLADEALAIRIYGR